MDPRANETLVEQTEASADVADLNELELTLVGGGCAEVGFA